MITRNANRAACVAALYILDRSGVLEGLTHQEIADLLGRGHRSTALRYMRDLAQVRDLVPELLDHARRSGPPLRQDPPAVELGEGES